MLARGIILILKRRCERTCGGEHLQLYYQVNIDSTFLRFFVLGGRKLGSNDAISALVSGICVSLASARLQASRRRLDRFLIL